MKVEIKSISSPDVYDLESYVFPAGTATQIFIELEIGETGVNKADIFSLTICNLKWVEDQLKSFPYLSGSRRMVTSEFDYLSFESYLKRIVAAIPEGTWDKITGDLTKHFGWEFENYNNNIDFFS